MSEITKEELLKWLQQQREEATEGIVDSIDEKEQAFYEGCDQMAEDTLNWITTNT